MKWNTSSSNNDGLLTEREGRTREYSPVRPEQARLESCLLQVYGTLFLIVKCDGTLFLIVKCIFKNAL